MNAENEEGSGICILSFDNGGPGTYSQLLILKEYMSRLAIDLALEAEDLYPADYFDLMGGVGFGGLIAIMLGYLRMNVDEAIDALITVATAVFAENSQVTVDPHVNSKNLKESIEEMLQARKVPIKTKMYERDRPQTGCKVIFYAATSNNLSHPQAFRTYAHRGASLNPTIVEALCATMAIPSYFIPVKIGRSQQRFSGGPMGTHNPTRELLKEASTCFGNDRRVAQIISIGCGIPPALSLESMVKETAVGRLHKEIPADCQMVAKELSARLCSVDSYLRLSVETGIGSIDMDQWDMLGDIEMHTACYVETNAVTNALECSVECLKRRTGDVTLAHLSQSSSVRTAAKKAPSVSPYFVRRAKEWEKLVSHLVTLAHSQQRILPITGMGGCGKTQLVSYFLQEYPLLFKHVAYVDASTLSSIKADLQAWVRALGNGHERDLWEDAVRILAGAPEVERWGLILDNADDPTLNFIPFIPKSINLTVIITSRNRNLGNLSTTGHIELGEMEPEEALATLLHAARRQLPLSAEESKSADILLKELGCLAVALVQAGTYCHELSYSFAQYLLLFKSHRADLMKRAEPSSLDSYERGAYTTLDLSYTALPQTTREFLCFISFFHHTDIPLAALATAAEYNFKGEWSLVPLSDGHARIIKNLKKLLCAEGKWSEMQVQDTLRTLRSFSLLSITSTGETALLQIHPLIQSWSRDKDPSNAWRYRLMATQIITSCSRDGDFQLYRYLSPHVLNLLGQQKSEELHIHDLMAAGKILRKQGRYQAAAGVFETAIEAAVKHNDPSTKSTVSGWLADVYRAQGRWSEAEKIEVEVLEQRKGILGDENPETICAAANLALTYYVQSRWSEAEKLGMHVLEQQKRILGSDHPETIWSAGNLMATFHGQGRWSEAEKLGVEVLERRRRVLGMEHPDTILAAANLAMIYLNQGRLNEAEKLGVEVLEQRRRIIGMDHPDTILAKGNLALTYRQQERWREAEKLELDVLEQRRKILGNEHPHTLLAALNIASTYHSQGRWSDAKELQTDVLEQRTRTLGTDHPDTIFAASELAVTFYSQGRWSEAEKLGMEVLEKRRRILGKEHPDSILAAVNLAATYRAQERWTEAEKLEVEVLEKRKRLMGHEHPDTISAAANLAVTYIKQGRWDESAALLAPAVQLSVKVLGQQHSHTQIFLHNLVFVYRKLCKEQEAQETQELLTS